MSLNNCIKLKNLFYSLASYSKFTTNKFNNKRITDKKIKPNDTLLNTPKLKFNSKKSEKFEFDNFNTNHSKYSLNYTSPVNEETKPSYLIEKTHSSTNTSNNSNKRFGKEKKLIAGKRMGGILPKQDYKVLKNQERRETSKLEYEKDKEKKQLALTTLNNRLLTGPPTTSIDRNDQNYIAIEKKRIKNSIEKLKSAKLINKRKLFNTENLDDFKNEERLSKRMSRLGVCSRRQAERMIGLGMVKVDGEIVKTNSIVDINNMIKINSPKGFKTPIPQTSRIWLYYKPMGYVCDAKGERNRLSIYDLLKEKNFEFKHYIVVGKLDINSEGLVILTNSGDIAQSLENNSTIERVIIRLNKCLHVYMVYYLYIIYVNILLIYIRVTK